MKKARNFMAMAYNLLSYLLSYKQPYNERSFLEIYTHEPSHV